ncbi:MAG: SUMF1/EgtB/PvdO family nonheme iron enzyme, partial [Verrucomicrobiia bacterium]
APAPKVASATPVATPPLPAQPPRTPTVAAKAIPPVPAQPPAVPRAVATMPKATPPQPGPTVMAKAPTVAPAPKVASATPVATPPLPAQPPRTPTVAAKAIPPAPAQPRVSAPAQPQSATTAAGPRVVARVPTATPPPPQPEPTPAPEPPAAEPAPPASVPMAAPTELRAVPAEPPPPVPAEFIPPPSPPQRASNPMIGAVLGPYSIKRVLGHGNWGSVFEAVQEQVNRTVAIKVLEPELHEDPAKVAQFSSLSSRMANRRHNNIVAVYEAGEFGGVHYYAREFIDGRTLQEIIESPLKLSPTHTLRVLMGVARALLYLAHHQIAIGPVPAKNILVDNVNGEPHVCGFSFLDGTSGELGNSATTEMPQLALLLWNALDPAAQQSQQVYALLRRLLTPDHPFPSLEHLLTEAETLERSFHKPVVKRAKSASAQRSAIKSIMPGKTPLSQRVQKKHYVLGGAVAGAVVLAIAGWFVFQQFTKLPSADVETFIQVPAGEFIYQSGEKKKTKEFWISKYEVTIGQYRKFWTRVREKGDKNYAHPKQPKDIDSSHTPVDWDRTQEAAAAAKQVLEDGHLFTDDYPVFNVTFWDAYAYAKWAGGRLPTQEEWEKAARGTDGRLYPWGNSFDDPKRANTGKDYDDINRGKIDGYLRWAPVNAHPGDDSPYHVRDMAGNVCEWTDSWVPMKNAPKVQVPVICGGSWADTEVRMTMRQSSVQPGQYHQVIGFRIVRDTPPSAPVTK